jgi:hypothetical protein
LKSIRINAPYFDGARLLIAADCTAYAYAAFHERFIKGHITLVGCPKLDAWVRIPSKRRELSAREAKTMSYENWKDKIGTFEVMDVRGKKMDFFPALKAKAAALKNGEGLHIIQTFEPVPLYPVLALMGFERHTEKVSGSEYHIWFYRVKKGE